MELDAHCAAFVIGAKSGGKKRQKGKQAAAEAVTDSKVKMYSSRRERDDLFEARTWIIEYNARAAAAAASIR